MPGFVVGATQGEVILEPSNLNSCVRLDMNFKHNPEKLGFGLIQHLICSIWSSITVRSTIAFHLLLLLKLMFDFACHPGMNRKTDMHILWLTKNCPLPFFFFT